MAHFVRQLRRSTTAKIRTPVTIAFQRDFHFAICATRPHCNDNFAWSLSFVFSACQRRRQATTKECSWLRLIYSADHFRRSGWFDDALSSFYRNAFYFILKIQSETSFLRAFFFFIPFSFCSSFCFSSFVFFADASIHPICILPLFAANDKKRTKYERKN